MIIITSFIVGNTSILIFNKLIKVGNGNIIYGVFGAHFGYIIINFHSLLNKFTVAIKNLLMCMILYSVLKLYCDLEPITIGMAFINGVLLGFYLLKVEIPNHPLSIRKNRKKIFMGIYILFFLLVIICYAILDIQWISYILIIYTLFNKLLI